ncbi:MAG: dehydratase, partial [Alphaproteobacteria bacterium]|nr:dehydratase [Alphaproteobacteria bacterium]
FLQPVFLGDTVTLIYRIAEIDVARKRSIGKIEVFNQDEVLVAVGQHILQWVPNPGA